MPRVKPTATFGNRQQLLDAVRDDIGPSRQSNEMWTGGRGNLDDPGGGITLWMTDDAVTRNSAVAKLNLRFGVSDISRTRWAWTTAIRGVRARITMTRAVRSPVNFINVSWS